MIRNLALALIVFMPTTNALCGEQDLTASVSIVDQSPGDCPLRLSGQMDLTKFKVAGAPQASFAYKLVVTNLSNKTIMAMVVLSHFGTSNGPLLLQHNEFDAYFSHEMEVAPGADFIDEHREHTLNFSMQGRGKYPTATSEVIFVQFTDPKHLGKRPG
jgi:hypothetical protein